jgi:hypothetical protein
VRSASLATVPERQICSNQEGRGEEEEEEEEERVLVAFKGQLIDEYFLPLGGRTFSFEISLISYNQRGLEI